MRHSEAALALIPRDHRGQRQWLTQWNESWRCYSFVGGHKQTGETFRQCLVREIGEELHLAEGSECLVAAEPLAHVNYAAWSERAQQDTQYTMELFDVQLVGHEARRKIEADPCNRWLSESEIRARRCRDGERVSETILLILIRAGLLESAPANDKGTIPMTASTIDVAVTLIRNSKNEILLVYNPKWGSYTLPMTKRRQSSDADVASLGESEDWLNAAARNVVECLGRPAQPKSVLKTPMPESHFSLQARGVKCYMFQVFEEAFGEGDTVADHKGAKLLHVWATPEQILKREIRPLSHTAHDLVAYDEILKFLS